MPRPVTIEEMVSMFKQRHKTAHLLKIDNFSLLTKYRVEPLCSSAFELGGHTWKLVVYPRGDMTGDKHVSVFLRNQASLDVTIKYELFAVSQLEPKWHSPGKLEFVPSPYQNSEGVSQLISLCDPKIKEEYFIGDCCMIGVKLYGVKDQPGTAECFNLIENPPNHKVTWMINNFSSLDCDKRHCSKEFIVGNRKWRINIYPRGKERAKGKSLSVYISAHGYIKNEPKTETYAAYKLRVLDQVNKNHVEHKFSNLFYRDEERGWDNFMPLEELVEPYLVKNQLYVGVDFEVISLSTYC